MMGVPTESAAKVLCLFRHFLPASFFLMAVSPMLFGQAEPDAPAIFHAQSRLVLVDVVVTNNGVAVGDLPPAISSCA
jgi:hypothetical protein